MVQPCNEGAARRIKRDVITQQIQTARAVRDSFSGVAGVYDLYTAHPHYASWVRGLVRLGEAHGAGGRRALDLGAAPATARSRCSTSATT